MPKTRKFNNYLIESLKDSKEASAYLNAALEEYKKGNCSGALKKAVLVPGTKRIKSIR